MAVKFSNNAAVALPAALTSVDTTITLADGDGELFPSLAFGDYFYATLVDVHGNLEIIKVTRRVGDVLTVERGQDNTLPMPVNEGGRLEHRVLVKAIVDASQTPPNCFCFPVSAVEATGDSQLTAAALFPGFNYVTGAAFDDELFAGTGVRLPEAQAGRSVLVLNSDPDNALVVYPAVGDRVNNTDVDSPFVTAPEDPELPRNIATASWYIALDDENWYTPILVPYVIDGGGQPDLPPPDDVILEAPFIFPMNLWGVGNPDQFRPVIINAGAGLTNHTNGIGCFGGYQHVNAATDLGLYDFEVTADITFEPTETYQETAQIGAWIGLEAGATLSQSSAERIVSFNGGVSVGLRRAFFTRSAVTQAWNDCCVGSFDFGNGNIIEEEVAALPFTIGGGAQLNIALRIRRVSGLYSVWLDDVLYVENFDPGAYRPAGAGPVGGPGSLLSQRGIGVAMWVSDTPNGNDDTLVTISNVTVLALGDGESFP